MNGHSPDQLTSLYDKLNEMCERNEKMEACLMGDFDKPGLIGMVRQTNDTIMLMKDDMSKVKTDIEDLKAVKQRLKGAMAASTAIGTLLGFLIKWVAEHATKS